MQPRMSARVRKIIFSYYKIAGDLPCVILIKLRQRLIKFNLDKTPNILVKKWKKQFFFRNQLFARKTFDFEKLTRL